MKYLNALNKIQGLGPKNFTVLLNFFETGENIWKSNLLEIKKSGIGEKLAEKISREKTQINPEEELEKLSNENVRMLSINDNSYPQLLKEIPTAPYILYIKSDTDNLDFNNTPLISIVGSRKPTQYGIQVASSIAQKLSQSGMTIVSGMAFGIDTVAHQSTLQNQGDTLAILGSGLDDKNIGPRSNFQLSRKIINNGALVSDYPLGVEASRFTFPARNRIMAGMTLGTIVVEATQRSGTLITANLALDFNREVFAVPGSIFSPLSQGPNNLLKLGAKPVTNINDILEELDIKLVKSKEQSRETTSLTTTEELIIKKLTLEPIHIDRISKLTKLEISKVSSILTILEMRGLIKNIGGHNYVRTCL
ncbi:DNA-processing protein DprA [Patescibacteria group bacterium]